MKHKRAAWTLFGAAALAAFFATLWNTSDLGRAAHSLEAQRAAARREGVPMEWGDLYRLMPPVAAEDNAAAAYARGFAALRAAGDLKGVNARALEESIPAGKAEPKALAALRSALLASGPALEEIRRGSLRRGYSFDRKWERGFTLLFPEFADARAAASALVLRALTAKDPAAAGDDLRTAARLGAHIGSEPVYIASLVGQGIEKEVHHALRRLGRRGGAWARAVEPVLGDLGPLPDLRRVLAAESVGSIHLTDEIAKHGFSPLVGISPDDSPPNVPAALRLARFGPTRDAFDARIVERWREIYGGLPKDPLDWRAAKAVMDKPIGAAPSYALLDLASPVFAGVGSRAAEMEAERRLSRAALDLWQGRAPALPADPFGNGPLKLRRDAKGWTLWSLGPDGSDDGGKPRGKASDRSYDLVVEG